jgi:hypothetical protein
LKSFFALKSEIFEFLKSKNIGKQFYENLQSISFMKYLDFLTDLMSNLNILNLKLQGRGQNICQLYSFIEGIRKKLEIFKNALENNHQFLKARPSVITDLFYHVLYFLVASMT